MQEAWGSAPIATQAEYPCSPFAVESKPEKKKSWLKSLVSPLGLGIGGVRPVPGAGLAIVARGHQVVEVSHGRVSPGWTLEPFRAALSWRPAACSLSWQKLFFSSLHPKTPEIGSDVISET